MFINPLKASEKQREGNRYFISLPSYPEKKKCPFYLSILNFVFTVQLKLFFNERSAADKTYLDKNKNLLRYSFVILHNIFFQKL